ncbi:D-alanine--poly(phosphoribitol) ligase subunit 2 [Paraburkholderia sp. BL8N3]|nr:acyl carrier protein [Paraburkholderia sp. BL8N3]TCK33632.1 D-alanine--poly(phosphoribitol) ligase subunit 2 [Paraburkholderia sp. BL8N3]
MTQNEKLHSEVASLVESVVLRLVRGDERLLEGGLVDSVLAVEIVMGVELQFGARIAPTEIAEHLASVDALCAFIAAHR